MAAPASVGAATLPSLLLERLVVLLALGSLTAVSDASFTDGNKKQRVYDVQITSGANYTTGGELVSPAAVGLSRIDQAIVHANPRSASGTALGAVGVDYATTPGSVKLLAFFSASGAADTQVSASTDLSTFSTRVTFIGS